MPMELPPPLQRALLIEDDAATVDYLAEVLQGLQLRVETERRGDRGLRRILDEQPRLVFIDVELPGLDGFEVCRRARPRYTGPIVLLSGRTDEATEVRSLEVGAEDFLNRSVRPRILQARVRSLLRRSTPGWRGGPKQEPSSGHLPHAAHRRGRGGHLRGELEGNSRDERDRANSPVVAGPVRVDPASRTAQVDGEAIPLTCAEFDLLWLLARNAGQVLDRDRIFRELRGIEYDGLDRSMDLRIARLRHKLGDPAKAPRIIKAIRGLGYLMVRSGLPSSGRTR